MPINKKQLLKSGLDMAVEAAKLTPNVYDDIIVKSAVAILYKIFNLEDI